MSSAQDESEAGSRRAKTVSGAKSAGVPAPPPREEFPLLPPPRSAEAERSRRRREDKDQKADLGVTQKVRRMSTSDVGSRLLEKAQAVLGIASVSTGLKGTCQEDLKDAARWLSAGTAELALRAGACGSSVDGRIEAIRLHQQVAALASELEASRREVAELHLQVSSLAGSVQIRLG